MSSNVNSIVATGAGGTLAAIAAGTSIAGLAYITGTPGVGNVFTANVSAGLTGTAWQWYNDGVAIGGATSQTYTQQASDATHTVTVQVNGILTSAGVVVPPALAVFSAPPTVTAASTTVAVTWTAGTLSNTGAPVATLTYNVYENGVLKATNATSGVTYTSSTIGATVTVEEVATNVAGAVTDMSAGFTVTNGASFPLLTSPKVVTIGDSITQYNNMWFAVTAGTGNISRASTGIITAPTGGAGNNLLGTPDTILVNTSDSSFEVLAQNNYLATSTLGATAGGSTNAVLYSSNTTVATANALTNCAAVCQDRFNWRGIFANLQGYFKGGLQFLLNNGHGGALAPFSSTTSGSISYALSLSPDLVLYMGGTNNVKGSQNATTTYNNILTDLNIIMAANVPCVVFGIIPLGAGNSTALNAVIQTVNSSLQSLCAANPTKLLYVDSFTPLYNSATQLMYAAFTTDGTHPVQIASNLVAQAAYSAMSPFITAPTIMARASTDAGTTINGHTRTVARGPWSGGSTINFGTAPFTNSGGSGTLPAGWSAGRAAGSGTVACSVVDPGDGLGFQVQAVCTAGAANDQVLIWPWGSAGTNAATLGASSNVDGTWYCISCEIAYSGLQAAGVGIITLQMNAPASPTYGTVTCGEGQNEAIGGFTDSLSSFNLTTGWFQMSNSNISAIVPSILVKFTSITGVAFTLKVRDVTILKR